MRPKYDRLTTTIKREWLTIVAGTKGIEYRPIEPYWADRLKNIKEPFEVRLLNGMNSHVPQATVLIQKINKPPCLQV